MRYRQCTLAIRLSTDSSLLCKGKTPPPCPDLSTLGQTLCSSEISLIEGCQLCDAQMQIRGSRHPAENRTDFHPAAVFDILERFVVLRSFSQLHPLFCFCLSFPPPSPTAPISTFFALPVLCQLAQKEWAPCNSGSQSRGAKPPTELHGRAGAETRPGKDLCRQRATSPQLACPRDPPSPTALHTSRLLGKEQKCPSAGQW